MSNWTAGYVSDVEYMPGFYNDMMPGHLDAVCLVAGVEPVVESGTPFRYGELGCGTGETAMAVAAGYPQAEVWGFDFNPAHIARGRHAIERGGLDNIRLEEASFEELNGPDWAALPQFDYIVLHGVWSWVSDENKAHIVRFLGRQLRPGGLAFVSYNAMPGWTPAGPLQHLLAMIAGLGTGRSDRRIVQSLDFAKAALDAGAGLPGEMMEGIEKVRSQGKLAYLSHEYLNEHWRPCYHDEVVRDFGAGKLSYVASANIMENFADICATERVRALLDGLPPAIKETARDYFMVRTFRRDLFMKGPLPILPRRVENRLRGQKLVLTVPQAAVTRKVRIPVGEAELNERFYGPALDELGRRVASVGELIDLPDVAGSTANPQEIIGMLIGSKQVKPAPGAVSDDVLERVRRYNCAHLRQCADQTRDTTAIVGAVIGAGVQVGLVEMLAYEAIAGGAPLEMEAVIAAAVRILESRGDSLRQEEGPDEAVDNAAFLRRHMPDVLAKSYPVWVRAGAI